jgi:hypothetical protein
MSEPKLTVTRFVTVTGSMYQVDNFRKKIRRFQFGGSAPSTAFKREGEWKAFHELSPVLVGKKVVIFWTDKEPPTPETLPLIQVGAIVIPFTATSIVASVEEEDQGDLN